MTLRKKQRKNVKRLAKKKCRTLKVSMTRLKTVTDLLAEPKEKVRIRIKKKASSLRKIRKKRR